MGCFLGCFGGAKSKDRRHRRRRQRSPAHSSPNARARCSPSKAERDAEAVSAAAPLLSTLLELRDSTDDLCLTIVKKKVTFDSTVIAYEPPAIPEGEEEEEADPAVGGDKGEEEAAWMLGPDCAKSEAFPLNHRYGNCAAAAAGDDDSDEEYYSDDEDEYEDGEEEYEDGIDAIDDEEDHGGGLLGIARGEEEACESLFLLPVVPRAKDGAGKPEPAAAPPVLGSLENFSEWKDASKPRNPATAAAPPKSSDKENLVTLGQENRPTDATLSDYTPKKKERPAVSADYTPSTPSKQEASVDASLSTWLGSTGTPESRSNSVRSYSPISREDRPILGALTVEDIKISSANSSPMRSRSPSPSPDDMPILGTVGAYWNSSGDDSVTRGGFMKTRSRFGQEQKW